MTGLLKNNFVATTLFGICGFVLLLGLVIQLTSGISLDQDAITDGSVPEEDFASTGLSGPYDYERYAGIDARPLFNNTRRPIAVDIIEGPSEMLVDGPQGPLNAALTGVMIVGDEMFVSLQDNDTQKFVRTRVGAGMDGAFADWKVEAIGPRSVTLMNFEGKEMKLEMQVAQTTPPPPAGSAPAENTANTQKSNREQYQQALKEAGGADTNESRAEEIRRRIAERRAQLQEAADRKNQQNGTQNDDK